MYMNDLDGFKRVHKRVGMNVNVMGRELVLKPWIHLVIEDSSEKYGF